MRKLMLLAMVCCGAGMCLLPACSRQSSTIHEPPDSSAAEATLPFDSTTADSPATGRTADGTSRSAQDVTSTARSDVKVELADHAQLVERIKSYQGRVVVVDVWSTSCLPCMKEFPHLVELARRWPEDVVCISLNVDYLGLPSSPVASVVPKVTEFLKSQRADPDNMVNLVSSEPDTDVLTKLGIESLPAILVTDRTGAQAANLTIDRAGSDGLTYAGDVVPLVEKLVEQQNQAK